MIPVVRGVLHIVRGVAIFWSSLWATLSLVVIINAESHGGELAGMIPAVGPFILAGVLVAGIATILLRHDANAGSPRGFDVVLPGRRKDSSKPRA